MHVLLDMLSSARYLFFGSYSKAPRLMRRDVGPRIYTLRSVAAGQRMLVQSRHGDQRDLRCSPGERVSHYRVHRELQRVPAFARDRAHRQAPAS